MFVNFESPRRWVVRIYGPMVGEGIRYKRHQTLGVVTNSAQKAITYVAEKYPNWRLDSCSDTGEVHFIVPD